MNWGILLLSAICGMAGATQSSLNGILGKKIGVYESTFVSFIVGTLLMGLIVIFFGQGTIGMMFTVPKWQLVGGVFGALFVLMLTFSVPKIGVASALTSVIIGQLIMSSIIDHYGLFGSQQIPINWYRVIGLGLMVIAIFLFYKK